MRNLTEFMLICFAMAVSVLIGAGFVFLLIGPLVLACIAALTGHVIGACILVLIQFLCWGLLE